MGSTTSPKQNECAKSVSKWKLCLLSIIVVACAVNYLHVPLPANIHYRDVMQVMEMVLRVMYKYPMHALYHVGGHWQLWWARQGLVLMAAPFNHWSLNDNDLTITDTSFAGVSVRVYVPKGERNSDGAVVFIHGGGFVLMDVPSYDGITREMARRLKMVVVSVDYRLAPEHPFPAGLNDCEAAVIHMMTLAYEDYAVDPHKIVIAGDSAGGNLASIVSQKLEQRQMDVELKAQVLLYPVIQIADLLTPSYQQFYSLMPDAAMLDPVSMARWLLMYFGVEPTLGMISAVLRNNHTSALRRVESGWYDFAHHALLPQEYVVEQHYTPPPTHYGNPKIASVLDEFIFHPEFCPLVKEDLSREPPTMLVTMEYDILRDEGYWYANKLKAAGVPTDYRHYDTGFHALLNLHTVLPLAHELMDDVVQYILKQVQ